MTKTIKKTPAVLMTAIIMEVSLCATAFATGTGNYTINTAASSNGTEATIEYSDVDNDFSRVSGENRYGVELNTFQTGLATTYTLSFTPSSGAATIVRFCDKDSTNVIASITIPKRTSGMPSTLTTTVTLDSDCYYAIKMKSNSSTTNTSGELIIDGLSGVYYM